MSKTPPPLPETRSERKSPLKVGVVVLLLLVAGGALLASAYLGGLFGFLRPEEVVIRKPQQRNALPEKAREVDYEKLYARIDEAEMQAYTRTVEAGTLAEYDRLNAKDAPWFAEGREATRLFAFVSLNGDTYGEGWAFNAEIGAKIAHRKGCRDPLILAICDTYGFRGRHSIYLQGAYDHLAHVDAMLASNYPEELKLEAISVGLHDIAYSSTHKIKGDDMTPFAARLAEYLEKGLQTFAAFLKTSPPPSLVYWKINTLLDSIDDSYESLAKAESSMDKILEAANAPGAVRAYAKGTAQISLAWAARGSGWAKTVTDDGWKKMAQHLKNADGIIDAASDAYPDVAYLPNLMITVELGQGTGQYRMNQWFERAVKIDPDYQRPYCSKIYYLQPKWHGSPQEVLDFAKTCIATGRWESGIPLAGLGGLSDLAESNEEFYKEPVLWDLVNKTYQEWLKRYPDSVLQRTKYFQWAVKAEKWDIARAQLEILGRWWDRGALNDDEFNELKAAIPPKDEMAKPG